MNRDDGLKKIYLIKSAGYEYQELNIGSNTLLLGDSGVGKTTIMRAVLFFYTMNYSDTMLNINPDTKKSFNDWYFKEHNSHLVYEYTRGESRFLFIVSKSGKLHYSFVDITNSSLQVKDLFLEGDLPLNLEKLNEKIQKSNLPNYYTSRREKYISTFHKRDSENRKIKQESSSDFTLFESISSRHEFAKTLSNIFASSKVSSLSLKKSIVSLINDSQASINLNTIKANLYDFISEKNEIEKFEQKIPTIQELALVHSSYKESKKEFKTVANRLESFKQNIAIEKEKNRTHLESLASQKEESSLKHKLASQTLQTEIKTIEEQLSVTHAKIEELQNKELFYKNKNIQELLEKYEKEPNFRNALNAATQRYEALTEGTQTLKLKYQELQNRLAQESQKMLNDLKIAQSQEERKYNQEINETIRSKEPRIQSALKRFVEEKKEYQKLLEKEQNRANNTKHSLAKIEYFPFNKEQIQTLEQEIQSFEKESSKVTLLSADTAHKIATIEQEIHKISQDLKQESLQLDEKTAQTKELLFKQKAKIEQRLNFESDNLYGYLNKNSIKNREKIVTYLKDEILFSEKKHTIKQIVHDTAVFGLEIEFEEEFSNEYKQGKLLEELHLLKEKIKETNKKAAKKKRDLEEQAQLQSKEKNRQRSLLYSQKEELSEKDIAYKKSSQLAHENLKVAKQKAKELQKESEAKLQKELAEVELSIQNYKEQIDHLDLRIQTTTEAISKDIEELINRLQEAIEKSQELIKTKAETLQEQYQKDAQNLQKELELALEKEGVDERLLSQISSEIKELKKELQAIEKNRTLVTVYLDQFQEKIKQLPQDIKSYEANKTVLKDLNEALELLEKKESLKLKEFEEQRKKLQSIKADLEKFSQAYSQKIENQAIEKSILNSRSLENPLEIIESNPEDLVEEIVLLYAKIKNDETKIESLVNNCRLVLKPNNIFKIEIENDYIDSISYLKTAKELIEYVKNDKISLHKELSSEMFKSSLISIKKDLALFEDALLDIDSEVIDLRNVIRKAVNSFNVIDAIKIRFENSNNEILNTLQDLSDFYDEHNEKFLSGLFSSQINDTQVQHVQEKLINKISDLAELLKSSKEFIMLEDGFVLEFKVVENGNDLKWRQTLNDIGSNGTSTLVKSIINISMLQMVSKNITKEANIVSHCILDEIGTISTDYFKELKDFVNRSGFVFLNGMPIEDDMLISMYPTIYVGQKHSNYSRMILASTMEI